MLTHSAKRLDARRLRIASPYQLEFVVNTSGFPTPGPGQYQDS